MVISQCHGKRGRLSRHMYERLGLPACLPVVHTLFASQLEKNAYTGSAGVRTHVLLKYPGQVHCKHTPHVHVTRMIVDSSAAMPTFVELATRERHVC